MKEIKSGIDYDSLVEKLEHKIEFSCLWNTCSKNLGEECGNNGTGCGLVSCNIDNMS
ncbi:hypothetical protein ACOAKC_11820 [Hathewaya histolytica]|uniref:hypothetical protein n=1 Tax=Hathewaya histolytica TaxID=1498 RepID=UPI003B677AFD